MKKCIIVLSLIIVTSCNAQLKNNPKQLKNHTMLYKSPVTKSFEKFDMEKYRSRKDKSDPTLREFLLDSSYVEMIGIGGIGGTAYSITPPNSYFTLEKIYFDNGTIKSKGLYFNNGYLQLGTWYEFDEQGKLVKEINYDKDYKLDFEDILEFCKKEGIKVDIGPILQSTGYHTVIRRFNNAQGRTWTIDWLKKPNIIEKITLDDETGKIIDRKDIKYINN